ncbi:universal stress protein [Mollicutes bacterium LVI A0078]|nr:universal stress protein [Mollicutes bacterium LVI A0075]WOO91019.1 universal stress protein [Mollicutes bacterium LVI A0078]
MKSNIVIFINDDEKKDRIVTEAIKQAKINDAKVIIFHLNEEEVAFAGYDIYIEPRIFIKDMMLGTDLMDIVEKLNNEGIENELVIMNSRAKSSTVYNKELQDKYKPSLIILGYNKENLIDRILGSTSENVIQYADCNVLVVK